MSYHNEVWLLASKPVADKVFKIIAGLDPTLGSQFDTIKVSPSGNTYMFHAYTWWNDLDANDKLPKAINELLDDVSDRDDAEEGYTFVRNGDERADWSMFESNVEILEGELYSDGCSEDAFDLWNDVDADGTIHEIDKHELCNDKWIEFQTAIKAFGMKTVLPLDKVIAPIDE
jgi:hypothetical protein